MTYHPGISVGSRIKEIRTGKGLTQKEFADEIGVVQGFLSGIERGRKKPSAIFLYAVCHKFNVNYPWLTSGQGAKHTTVPATPGEGGSAATIPLLDKIPPGFPETLPPWTGVQIQMPHIPQGCYAILAEGDYMAPTIRDGDLVIFQPGAEPENKNIVLMSNRWEEAILRRYRTNGVDVVFSPDNSVYAPFTPELNTTLFGTVREVWRKVRL